MQPSDHPCPTTLSCTSIVVLFSRSRAPINISEQKEIDDQQEKQHDSIYNNKMCNYTLDELKIFLMKKMFKIYNVIHEKKNASIKCVLLL